MDTMMNKLWKIAMCISMLLTLLPMDIGMAQESIVDTPIVANENLAEEEMSVVDGQPADDPVEEIEGVGEGTPAVEGDSEETDTPEAEVTGEGETGDNTETGDKEETTEGEPETTEGEAPEVDEYELVAKKIEEILDAVKKAYPFDSGFYVKDSYDALIQRIRDALVGKKLSALEQIDIPTFVLDYKKDFEACFTPEHQAELTDTLSIEKKKRIEAVEKEYVFNEEIYVKELFDQAMTEVINEINNSSSLKALNGYRDYKIKEAFAKAFTEEHKLKQEKDRRILEIQNRYDNTNGIYENDKKQYDMLMRQVIDLIEKCKDLESLKKIDDADIEEQFNEILSAEGSFPVAKRKKFEWVKNTFPFDPERYEQETYDQALKDVKELIDACEDAKQLSDSTARILEIMNDALTDDGRVRVAREKKFEELKAMYPFDGSKYLKNAYDALLDEIKKEFIDENTDIENLDLTQFSDRFEEIERPKDLVITNKVLSDFDLQVGDRSYDFNGLKGEPEIPMSTTEKVKIHLNARVWNDADHVDDVSLTGSDGVKFDQRIIMWLPELIESDMKLVDEDGVEQDEWLGFFVDDKAELHRNYKNNADKFASYIETHPDVKINTAKIPDDAVAVYRVIPAVDEKGNKRNLFVLEYLREYLEENARIKSDTYPFPKPGHGGVRNLDVTLETKINRKKAEDLKEGLFMEFGDLGITAKFESAKRLTNVDVRTYFNDYDIDLDGEKIHHFETTKFKKAIESEEHIINTRKEDDYVYYKVIVEAKADNTIPLENVILTQFMPHKKFKNLDIVEATRGSKKEDILLKIKKVKFNKKNIDTTYLIDPEKDMNDIPKASLFGQQKAYSYNLGTMKNGERIELVFRGEIDSKQLADDISSLKTVTADGVTFDHDEMKKARMLRCDSFVTASNLETLDGKKFANHDSVKPYITNDDTYITVDTTTIRGPKYNYKTNGRNNQNQILYEVRITNDEDNPFNTNKYMYRYVPFVSYLGRDRNAKLSYVEDLKLVDQNLNEIRPEDANLMNFKLRRNEKNEIVGYEGLYKEIDRPGVNNPTDDVHYVLVTLKDDVWKEDRGEEGDILSRNKAGKYYLSSALGHMFEEEEDRLQFEYYTSLANSSGDSAAFERIFISKGADHGHVPFGVSWSFTVYPSDTETERLIKDDITADPELEQRLTGNLTVTYSKDGAENVVVSRPFTTEEANSFEYTIPSEYASYYAKFNYESEPIHKVDEETEGSISNDVVAKSDGYWHTDSAGLSFRKRDEDDRSYNKPKKRVVKFNTHEATWEVTLFNILKKHDAEQENLVRYDSLSDQSEFHNFYLTDEQFDAIEVRLGDGTVVDKSEYTIEPIIYDGVLPKRTWAPSELEKKNAAFMKDKTIGFTIKPVNQIGDEKNPIIVTYDTTLYKSGFGKFKQVQDINDPEEYVRVGSDLYRNQATEVKWAWDKKLNGLKEHVFGDYDEFRTGNDKEVFTYFSHREGDMLYWNVVVNANGYLGEALGLPYKDENGKSIERFNETLYAIVPEGLELEGAYPMDSKLLPLYNGKVWDVDASGEPDYKKPKKDVDYYGGIVRFGSDAAYAPQRMDFQNSPGGYGHGLLDYGSSKDLVIDVDAEHIGKSGRLPIQLKKIFNRPVDYSDDYTYWHQFVVRTRITDEQVLLGVYPRVEPSDDPADPKILQYKFAVEFDGEDKQRLSDDSLSESIKINPMTKTPHREDGSLVVDYEIDMNVNGGNLLKNSDVVRVYDTSNDTLKIRVGSITVAEVRDGKEVMLPKISSSQAENDPELAKNAFQLDLSRMQDDHTVIFTVPDNRHLKIRYKADINPVIQEDGELIIPAPKNTAYFGDFMNLDHLSSEKSSTEIFKTNGSIIGQSRIAITKVDEEFTNLTNAVYEFEIFKDGNWIKEEQPIQFDGTDDKVVSGDDESGYVMINRKRLTINHPYTLYRFVETAAPEGYAMDPQPTYIVFVPDVPRGQEQDRKDAIKNMQLPDGFDREKIQILTRGSTLELLDKKIHYATFKKIDKESKKVLEGAKFELYNAKLVDGGYAIHKKADLPSNVDPKTENYDWVSELQPNTMPIVSGNYILKETKAPKRYESMKPMFINVGVDGAITTYQTKRIKAEDGSDVFVLDETSKEVHEDANSEIVLENEVIKAMKISKRVADTGDDLAGVTFKITKKGKNYFDAFHKEMILEMNGDTVELERGLKVNELKAGKEYVLEEIKHPGAYEPLKYKINFAFEKDGTISHLGLLDESGNPVTVDGMDQIVEVNDNNLIVYNKKKKLKVSKRLLNSKSEDDLDGIPFELYDEVPKPGESKPIESWVSEKKPHEFTTEFVVGKPYYLKEVYLPHAGGIVQMNGLIKFVYNEDGSVNLWKLDGNNEVAFTEEEVVFDFDTFRVMNKQVPLEVDKYERINKKYIPIKGTKFQILNEEGTKVLDEWETEVTEKWGTDVTTHVVTNYVFDFHKPYRLREVQANGAYVQPKDDIKFVYNLDITKDLWLLKKNDDGSFTEEEMPRDFAFMQGGIRVLNKRKPMKFEKLAYGTDTRLEGAKFELRREDDNRIHDLWTSDEEARKLWESIDLEVPYILTETKQPEGYLALEHSIRLKYNEVGKLETTLVKENPQTGKWEEDTTANKEDVIKVDNKDDECIVKIFNKPVPPVDVKIRKLSYDPEKQPNAWKHLKDVPFTIFKMKGHYEPMKSIGDFGFVQTDENGEYIFKNLTPGSYVLIEGDFVDVYEVDGKEVRDAYEKRIFDEYDLLSGRNEGKIYFKISDTGKLVTSFDPIGAKNLGDKPWRDENEENTICIPNKKTSIAFNKFERLENSTGANQNGLAPVEGMTFKVYKDSEFTKHLKDSAAEVSYRQATTDENGRFVIYGLEWARRVNDFEYVLVEEESPTRNGKGLVRKAYNFTYFLEDGIPTLTCYGDDLKLAESGITLMNDQTTLFIEKLDATTDEVKPMNDVYFNIYTKEEFENHKSLHEMCGDGFKDSHSDISKFAYHTDEKGMITVRGLVQEKEYVLCEAYQEGYEPFEPVHFKLVDTVYGDTNETVEIIGQRSADDVLANLNTLTVKNRKKVLVDLDVSKVDEDNNKVENAKFKVIDDCGKAMKVVTAADDSSKFTFEKLVVGKTYRLEETAPKGYHPVAPMEFKLVQTEDGLKIETEAEDTLKFDNNQLIIVNRKIPTCDIEIHKKRPSLNTETKEVEYVDLEGAAFEISNGKDTIPVAKKEGSESIFVVKDLLLNTPYTLKETTTPSGYVAKKDSITFEINENKEIVITNGNDVEVKDQTQIHVINRPIPLFVESFVTTDMVNGIIDKGTLRTAGFVYDLYEVVTNPVPGSIYKDTITSKDETIALPEFLMPGKTYKMVSVQAPFGVALADDVVFEVKNDGMLQFKATRSRMNVDVSPRISKHEVDGDVLQIIHRPLSLDVQKYEKNDSSEDAAVLTGVTFEVSMNGEPITKWESSKDAKTLVPYELAKKNLSETITLVETPKGGYVGIEPIEIRFTNTGSMLVDGFELIGDELKVFNHKTTVTIQKIDAKTKQPLTGAVFAVNGEEEAVDADGKLVVEGLLFGNSYKVHEVSSPEGYMAGEDVTFELETDGQVVEVENKKAKYFIGSYFEKVQEGNELAGCEYLIKDGENVVSKVVSSTSIDEIVDALERNKTYTIEEVKVVDGIVYVDDVKFEINKRGELVLVGDYEHANVKGNDTIQIVHKPTRLDVRKVDESKHRLMGAVFEMIDEDTDTVVHTWTSHDLKDEKIIKVLACDHRYVLKEVKVVDGYEDKQGDIHIAIDHKGRTMVDNEVVELLVKVNNKIQEAVVEVPKTPSKKETVVSNEHKLSTSTGDMLFVRNYAMVLVSAIVGVVVSCVRLMK